MLNRFVRNSEVGIVTFLTRKECKEDEGESAVAAGTAQQQGVAAGHGIDLSEAVERKSAEDERQRVRVAGSELGTVDPRAAITRVDFFDDGVVEEQIEAPQLQIRCAGNLYWNQERAGRWGGNVRPGLAQGRLPPR